MVEVEAAMAGGGRRNRVSLTQFASSPQIVGFLEEFVQSPFSMPIRPIEKRLNFVRNVDYFVNHCVLISYIFKLSIFFNVIKFTLN